MALKSLPLLSLILLIAMSHGGRRNSVHLRPKNMQSAEHSSAINSSVTGKCDKRPVLMTKSYGTLRSPGYPRLYGNKQRCTWHISVPRGFRIRIRFRRQFQIEDSSDCSKDYIMLAQSKYFRNPLVFCGNRRPTGILTLKNNMWIRFLTDNEATGRGFLASYTTVDDNECVRSVCTFPSLCRNTVGSYACDCPDGYKNRGRREAARCVDINECNSGLARCDHKCFNTDGSYYCMCRKGYRLAADGKRCRDVNECNRGKTGCSHFCRNTRSSYRCTCPKGFKLLPDKKTCYPEVSFYSQQYMATITENAQTGSVVTAVKAISFTKSRKIRYLIKSENLRPPTMFAINQNSGKIIVNGKLDREKRANYLLEVVAGLQYSNGSISHVARTYVIVNVLDENDNPPVFKLSSYYLKVPCNVSAGRVIYRVQASDKDGEENARIRYTFQPRNTYFTILPNTGRVRVIRGLHRLCNSSPPRSFILSVIARDHGVTPMKAHAWMQLVVTPPGILSRTASGIEARFLDPINEFGPGGVETITRRKVRNPQPSLR